MTANNALNNNIAVATGTSLNLGSSTTINGVINDNTFATASATTAATSSSIKAYADAQPKIYQAINSSTGAVASGATTIPYDDTIPQNTEGVQYLTVSITPTNAAHSLFINVVLNCSPASANVVTVAVFQDSNVNAIASGAMNIGAGSTGTICLNFFITTGTTSSTTFNVRAGATGSTLTVNGIAAARKLGGVCISSITLTEVG